VDTDLAEQFKTVADQFIQNESKILEEIASAEGKPTDIGGYYLPDDTLAENAMRPSKTLNSIVNSL
jgi:isocitrate dehydrogenase